MGYQVTNQYGAILVNDESTLNEPKEIRFITPEYREKFKLPDGGHVLIGRRNGSVTEHKCKFLDPYHFLLDPITSVSLPRCFRHRVLMSCLSRKSVLFGRISTWIWKHGSKT